VRKAKQIFKERHLPPIAKAGLLLHQYDKEDLSRNDVIFEPHRDTHAIFNFATAGSCTFLLDFERYALKAPVVVMVFPGQVHQIEQCINVSGWSIAFDPLLMNAELTQTLECIFQAPLSIEGGSNFYQEMLQFLSILTKIYEQAGGVEQTAALQGLFISMLQWTAGNLKQSCHCSTKITDRAGFIVSSFKSLLQAHYVTHKQPGFYSEQLNISTTHLGDTIKSLTGKSVSTHIQQISLLQAKRYLYKTDLSIKEICFLVGYDDPVHFGKLFKKHCQLTPLEFRKQIRE